MDDQKSTENLAVQYAQTIIFGNEGAYGSVNKDDNGALSVGKVQWHASRALSLLKAIIAKNPTKAQSTLGDALYNEITSAAASAWNKRTVTADEAALLKKLLNSAQGKAVQDAQAAADVTVYVQKGESYGLEDCGALIYFADGVNQYGTNSTVWKKIAAQALASTGDAAAMLAATKAATSKYLDRREKVYNEIVALNLNGDTEPAPAAAAQPDADGFKTYEIRVTTDALNIRSGPGTNYKINGVIRDRGMYTITAEASGTGAKKWGKLYSGAGYIALDYTKKVN
ncbi:MAG: hypothetical protein LBS19_12270 [Clostridiales bacterium]|jgi:uncharacterized protein YgiM (DUF1202 family)|nr:hypothetical protein [Clostridiales bacterium]